MAQAVDSDRYEQVNRAVYGFNRKLDRYALKPATQVYRAVTPEAGRRGISNGLSNLQEPLSFFNAIAQGKIKQAFRTLDRLIINTTLGVGGLADNATDLGRPAEPEDFGQTLAVWGVKSGPYLMLPLLGPSTLRDGRRIRSRYHQRPRPLRPQSRDRPDLPRQGRHFRRADSRSALENHRRPAAIPRSMAASTNMPRSNLPISNAARVRSTTATRRSTTRI